MHSSLLIIFIKNAIKGKVKTRLAKDLGDDRALEVYQQLLEHTRSISQGLKLDKVVCYSESIEENDIWPSNHYHKDVQKGNDLGERMSSAFRKGFQEGYSSISIIGSDCYDLSSKIIEKAFLELKKNDFVIGPANDGGYYLIGMNQYFPKVFENKVYSTSNVFMDAVDEIKKHQKNYFVLPELTDIDDISDLKKFQ